jgi:hypothetical protein
MIRPVALSRGLTARQQLCVVNSTFEHSFALRIRVSGNPVSILTLMAGRWSDRAEGKGHYKVLAAAFSKPREDYNRSNELARLG